MEVGEGSPEIVFFDVETTIPWRKGQRFALLEFGAILVCPRKLVELQSFSTLLRPDDLSAISEATTKCNGISRQAVAGAPKFQDVADKIYDLLDGRVWAGHNVVSFDCLRIREAFADIGRPAPTAKGIIDSFRLLQVKFGRRAGNLKMATLANYFGLGSQKHRSLDDVRMNLEVLKYCATVLFLEENYPEVLLDEMSSTPLKLEMPDVSSSRSQQRKASGESLSEGKVGKPSKKKSPVKNSVKIVSNSSVKENKEESNSRLKEIKKLSGASIKATNSEADNGHFDLTDMNRLQSIWSQGQALQEEHVGASSNPSNPVLVSVTEQSESNQSECILEPHEVSNSSVKENKEVSNFRLKEIKKLSGASINAMNSEAGNGHFDFTVMFNRLTSIWSQGQALQEEHVGASSNPSNPVLFSVTEQSESNQSECFLEPLEVSNSSVEENNEVSNSRLKELKTLSDASIKAMNSEADNGHFDLTDMSNRLQSISSQGQAMQEEHVGASSNPSNPVLDSVTEQSESNRSECFLEPQEISTSSLKTLFLPRKWGTEKMILLHKDLPLRMSSRKMKIRFGISKKFFVPTGRPKLSFVVEPSLETCEILKACDNLAQKLYSEFNGESEWKPLVLTKQSLVNASPLIRMHIASTGAGETAAYITELYQRDSSGTTKSFPFTTVDIDELDKLFVYGRLIDADYSFDIYDYQQNAGIRLVARRLTVDCGRNSM